VQSSKFELIINAQTARMLETPVYGPRKPRKCLIDPFVPYLRERVVAYPGLTGRRLWRELRERGYEGGYTAVTDVLRDIRPAPLPVFEIRFETPPGDQAQVDFAQFQLQFTDEPTITRIVWLFSFVLGFSRLIWAHFVLHQDMQTVLRCHMAAFEAIGGIPNEILYDRMKTAVIGEAGGSIVYNSRAHRLRPSLRLPAEGLPSLPGQNQGQGRETLSLHPRGLLPRPLVPEPR
jgi:transposase